MVVAPYLGAARASQPGRLKDVMQTKLTSTRALLEPVVRADFAAVRREVEALSWISEREIASWQDAAEPEYTQQAELFLLSVNELRDAAVKRDIGAVASEYTALVSSCVHCHAYVSRTRRATLSPPGWLAGIDPGASQ
jgi:hypothetical protein